MAVEKEEILHIAKLANLSIKEEEIQEYSKNLEDILNFAKIINKLDTENVEESIGIGYRVNVFRKDEVIEFEDKESLLQNAPEKENNMFRIPKVI
jgi:aspartyl-tRNA(Asn)/glutamyl-tRNA(Gln) amidotransferase subunit C